MELKNSKNLLYGQLGAAVLVLTMLGFGAIPTVVGGVVIFGVIGLFGAWLKPRLLGMARYYLYLAVFSVIVVMTSNFFPFIGGKDYFFRFSVELALVFSILWWAFEAKDGEVEALMKEVYKKPVFIAVTLFVLVYLLASIFAFDPHAAFWSNYERGEGGFQMLHYYGFFTLLVLLLRKESDWRAIFKTSLVAAGLMILYGVFAQLGWAATFISPFQGAAPPSAWWERLFATNLRFQGSLGNPAYVAPYLMFAMFYALYLWVTGKPSNERKWATRICYGAAIFIFFVFFILSQTRGAFLGLGAAVFAYILYFILFKSSFRKKAAAVFVAIFVLSGILFMLRGNPVVKSLPGGRLLDINFSDQTAQTRFWTWGSAWHGFSERPILGWGPENFSAVFDKYFDTRHYNPGAVGGETWFDRAHSIYLDYLSETGILGFLSYLVVFAVIFWGLFKERKDAGAANATEHAKPGPVRSPVVNALMMVLPLGYLVQGIAIFDVLPMYINLFLFFAFAYYYLYDNESHA